VAGGYPAAPGQRIAYDSDKTVVAHSTGTGGPITVFGTNDVNDLNDESSARTVIESSVGAPRQVTWMFPRPMDLFGVWAGGEGDGSIEYFFENVSYSLDAIAVDTGSWTNTGIFFNIVALYWDTWRTDFQLFSATAALAARGVARGKGGLEFTGKHIKGVFWWGAVNDAATPDRLILLDKDTGLESGLYDWGYLPRGTTKEKVFNVRNNSATFQADAVTVGFTALMSHNPHTWFEVKDGGGAYSTQVTLGNIALATTYANDITVKVVSPSTAGLGPFTTRIALGQTGWT